MRAQKGSTARVAKCAERIFTLPEICIERERYYTNSYQETEGEPPCLRQAKAFAKTLDHMSIQIYLSLVVHAAKPAVEQFCLS